ncbi:hypothetical protein TNIN_499131 [Trichonephila inaurata madagascariensis]|uniref:Uncharacterized protein n=1 Tax=Trichonephila inaurata madagascariensis TaxID=2747483 RepID=A0A8X7BQ33_9ARAC|nr:hypothetical protein TNIN_499131 [Trichonephila inaurata madagascariensis]
MIDDLEAAIHEVPGMFCLFFADDGVIWAMSSNILFLEDALNSPTWANTNKKEVNVEKNVPTLPSVYKAASFQRYLNRYLCPTRR